MDVLKKNTAEAECFWGLGLSDPSTKSQLYNLITDLSETGSYFRTMAAVNAKAYL